MDPEHQLKPAEQTLETQKSEPKDRLVRPAALLKKPWYLAAAIAAVFALVAVAVVALHGGKSDTSQTDTTTTNCPTPTASGCGGASKPKTAAFDPSNGKCTGHGPVKFTVSPIPTEQLGMVLPLGTMVGGHVTPIDHGYMFGIDGHNSKPNQYPVRPPADGIIVDMSVTARTGEEGFNDYAITISHNCTITTHFLNMDSFDASIVKQAGEVQVGKDWHGAIPVKAGQVIGHTGTHGIDVYTWNADVSLSGFIHPEQYSKAENWKIHTVDPYGYYVEPLRSQILAKDVRVSEPRGGKIDYDVKGKLVGTWFREGSGGYAGLVKPGEGNNYWIGHLSIVPDAYDPTATIVSTGDWQGKAMQFMVARGAANPADVSASNGLIKYDLYNQNWVRSNRVAWDHTTFQGALTSVTDGREQGTVLLQVLDDEHLKVETFPGKTSAQVTGFTPAAQTYTR